MFPKVHIKKSIALFMVIALIIFTAYSTYKTGEVPREFLIFSGIIIGFYFKNEKEEPTN